MFSCFRDRSPGFLLFRGVSNWQTWREKWRRAVIWWLFLVRWRRLRWEYRKKEYWRCGRWRDASCTACSACRSILLFFGRSWRRRILWVICRCWWLSDSAACHHPQGSVSIHPVWDSRECRSRRIGRLHRASPLLVSNGTVRVISSLKFRPWLWWR